MFLAVLLASREQSVFPAITEGKVVIGGREFSVDLANTSEKRARGLSGREGLGEGDGSINSPHRGMLFLFDRPGNYGFWMSGMEFPIDVIWISGNRIAGFAKNLEPSRGILDSFSGTVYPPGPVNRVLEVSAGLVDEYGFAVGDAVSLFLDAPRASDI